MVPVTEGDGVTDSMFMHLISSATFSPGTVIDGGAVSFTLFRDSSSWDICASASAVSRLI